MNMDDLELTLIAYADGELDPIEVQELEQRLAQDPALRARVQEYRDSAAILRAACAENFYTDGMAHLLLPRRQSTFRTAIARRSVVWAVAASLVAAVFGFSTGTYWAERGASAHDSLLTEVAEYHDVYARETKHLVEVSADRSEELFAWLSERMGRTVSAPDLTAAGLHFAGGRMLVVGGKPVAELMYTRENGRPVAFCITPDDDGKTSAMRIDERGHIRLASWKDGKHTFVFVGEMDRPSLQRVASFAAAQSGS
jgi:anti-sigma factor RsiW